MTTTATLGACSHSGPSIQKSRGLADVPSAATDNSLFAALLQGSFVQPLAAGQKETPLGDSKSVMQSITAASQRQKTALSVATTGLHQDGRVQVGLSKGQGAVKGLPELAADAAGILEEHPVDTKESSVGGPVTEIGTPNLSTSKNSALKTVSLTVAQTAPLAQTASLAQTRSLAPTGNLVRSTAKVSASSTETASATSTAQHGSAYVSAEGDKAQPFVPIASPVASLGANQGTNHGRQREAVHTAVSGSPVSKPALGKALDSVPETASWTAFAPVTTQPAKPVSVAQASSPTVQFGDLKSVYDITQAMIGQADGGNQQIQVQVHPQGLGNLLISVVQTPGGIAVHMQAEQMATAQWLNGQSSSLVNQLQQQGLDVAGVNVSFGSSNPQSGGSDGQQRRGRAIDGLGASRSVVSSNAVTRMGDERLRTTQSTSSTSWSGIGYSAWA